MRCRGDVLPVCRDGFLHRVLMGYPWHILSACSVLYLSSACRVEVLYEPEPCRGEGALRDVAHRTGAAFGQAALNPTGNRPAG